MLLFAIIVGILVVLSLVADYKWRRWVDSRRNDRNHDQQN
jgi:hypothetical protein